MSSTEREAARELLRRLATTPAGSRIILAGSSGLYTASNTLPALTEDLDFLVDADWLALHETDLVAALGLLGFHNEPGTATFVDSKGVSLDLVGYSLAGEPSDRIGGGPNLRVMVYSDLSLILSVPTSVVPGPEGGSALSPAALAASKLLTVRLEKGSKDKIQALLLVDEHGRDPRFREALSALLSPLGRERLSDLTADAQAAVLTLSADPLRADPQSAGYAQLHEAAARGLTLLAGMVGK